LENADVPTSNDVLGCVDCGGVVTLGLDDVASTDEDMEVCEAKSVVLLPNIDEDELQSTGMLLPSSSSRDSGARVQAGPGVSLLIEFLLVTFVVVVE
jgi:hypothetical protein